MTKATKRIGKCERCFDFIFEVGRDEVIAVKFSEHQAGWACTIIDGMERIECEEFNVAMGFAPDIGAARECLADYLNNRN